MANNEIQKSLNNIKDSRGYNPSNEEIYNTKKTILSNKGPDNKISKIGYVPKLTAIFSNGEVLELVSNISILKLDINLNEYIFPIFSLRLNVPLTYVPRFQFDDDLLIKLELIYNNVTNTDTPSMYNTSFITTLKKIKQISSPVIADEKLYENNGSYLKKIPLELKLIPIECLNFNKNLVSGVYRDANITQILCLITENIGSKTFIAPPDNTRKYNQIVLPPSNIFYAIQYLDQFYGIYNNGLKMFFGLDQNVILPRNYATPAGINKLQINFGTNTTDGISPALFLGGYSSKMGSDNFLVTTPDKVSIVDSRLYIKESLGSIINTFSRDTSSQNEQFREYNTNDSLQKIKTYINQYNNDSKEKEMLSRSNYTKNLKVMITDFVLDPDSWFKPFKVDFESDLYSQLNGNYCMTSYSFKIMTTNTNNDTAIFDTSSTIGLIEI